MKSEEMNEKHMRQSDSSKPVWDFIPFPPIGLPNFFTHFIYFYKSVSDFTTHFFISPNGPPPFFVLQYFTHFLYFLNLFQLSVFY